LLTESDRYRQAAKAVLIQEQQELQEDLTEGEEEETKKKRERTRID